MTLESELNLSDIFQINAQYYDVDPDFSNLDGSSNNSSKSRSRFSPRYSKDTISPYDKIRIDMDFKLHNILPEKLGLDVPIDIKYEYDDRIKKSRAKGNHDKAEYYQQKKDMYQKIRNYANISSNCKAIRPNKDDKDHFHVKHEFVNLYYK